PLVIRAAQSGRHDGIAARLRARLSGARPRSPIFFQQRPAIVVTPAVTDFQEAAGLSLTPEPESFDECNRTAVIGLNVRFEPVQAELAKRARNDQRERFAHEPSACVR